MSGREVAIRLFTAALLALATLAGCGGADPQLVRTGGTGAPKNVSVSVGVIEGLGSVVVNGIRYDETGARVTINGAPDRPVSELQLGMVVEVRGEVDGTLRAGKAESIVASALLAGPVESVNAAGGEVTILGQPVELVPGVALLGTSGAASLRAGDFVVVYGYWDMLAGHVDATRLEVKSPAPAEALIIGRVSAVSGGTFRIGTLAVDAGAAVLTNLAGGIAVGRYVEVRGTAAAGSVRAVSVTGRAEFDPLEGALTEIEGFVTDFASAGAFRVLGTPVNAANARLAGTGGAIANGAFIEVEGSIVQGVLVATLVEVRSGPLQVAPPAPSTVLGDITDFVSIASFRVRGQAVDASAATITGGTAAGLSNGRQVQVTGLIAGNVLKATTVAFVEPVVPAGTRTIVSGTIDGFTSAQGFFVNGQFITTTGSTAYVGGAASQLANGRVVEVDGMLTGGTLTAMTVTFKAPPAPSAVSLSGTVTDFVSAANFRVNNQAITTTAQTVYESGTAANLANGRRLEIEGLLSGGVVTATKIHFADQPGTEPAEVEGRITEFVSVSNFKVQGQVVDASAAVFSNGRASDLANGLKVHAKGPIAAGVLRARTLEIDR
jgi:hypothetical protein